MAERVEPTDGTTASSASPGTSPQMSTGVLAGVLSDLIREALSDGADRPVLDRMVARIADLVGAGAIHVERFVGAGELELVAAHGHENPRFSPAATVRFSTDEGIGGDAFRSGRAVVTTDADTDPRWSDVSGGRHRSGVALPMRLPDRTWGVLGLEDEQPGRFTQADAEVLQPVADMLAWVLESTRLRHEAEERARREERLRRGLEASTRIVTAGLEASGIEATLDRMVREIRQQLGWETLGIMLREGDDLRLVAYVGEEPLPPGTRFHLNRGIVGMVATTGRSYLCPDTGLDAYFDEVVPGSRSELCVPLRIAGQVRGLINAESPEPNRFDRFDLDILERIAAQMSLILNNAELLASEQDTVSRLHELDQLKSRLLAIASHELRTPLTVVMGFAEVLAEHHDTIGEEKRQEYLGSIVRQAASLSQLVDQMLVATQIENGQLQVQVGPCALAEVVHEALGPERAAHIEVGPGVAACRVSADPFRLRQVLENLFDNAIKYAADVGRVQVDARRSGDVVTLLLRDEGPGVPGYEHERVFQPFHQVGEHGVAGRRGIGLGLAVARDLVALMGGELKLFSAEGYGATFTLELPAVG